MLKFKRLIAIVLTLGIASGAFVFGQTTDSPSTLTASAEEYYGIYTYEQLEDGTVSIVSCGSEVSDTCGDEYTTELTIPSEINGKAVTKIEDKAFLYCSSLDSITVPDSITSIGEAAFCNGLKEIIVDSQNKFYTSEDGVLFNKQKSELICFPDAKAAVQYTIPDSVTSIGNYAFSLCQNLENVIIPDSVTSIGNYAFHDCWNLESVNIPESVTSIGDYAFAWCERLTSVNIPDSVTSISNYAFYECHSLESVTISKSVTGIGDYAFAGCPSLTGVTIPDNIKYIGYHAFAWCGRLTSITIPSGVTSIGTFAFGGCESLTDITVETENELFSSADGILFNKEQNKLLTYPAGKTEESFTIPDSVINIDEGAFNNCESLESITIPDSVKYIGVSAFSDCTSLKGITIPDSVTDIEGYTFSGCTNLTEVNLPDGIKRIGSEAFSDCTNLAGIALPDSVTQIEDMAFSSCKSLESITIPDSVKGIDYEAFADCDKLKSITIPKSITVIDYTAFFGCANLNNVYFSGNKEQWESIVSDGGTSFLSFSTVHFSDGDIKSIGNGDIDQNGSLDIVDIVMARAQIVNGGKLTQEQLEFADINSDGALDIADVVILRSKIARAYYPEQEDSWYF